MIERTPDSLDSIWSFYGYQRVAEIVRKLLWDYIIDNYPYRRYSIPSVELRNKLIEDQEIQQAILQNFERAFKKTCTKPYLFFTQIYYPDILKKKYSLFYIGLFMNTQDQTVRSV